MATARRSACGGQAVERRGGGRRDLGLHRDLVQRGRASDPDPELRPQPVHRAQRRLDRRREDVRPADDEHVVEPAQHALGHPRVGPPARARVVGEVGLVPRREPDHGLGLAPEVGVDDRAAPADRHRGVRVVGGDDLHVHLVGDQVGAGARGAAHAGLERVHLRRRPRVDDGRAPALLDEVAGPGQGAPGLTAHQQGADRPRREVDAHPLGHRQQVHAVRRRRREHRRPEPSDQLEVPLGVGDAEREHGRADPFEPLQHTPAAEEQPEREPDLGDVVRPDTRTPLGHRVHVRGAVPVAP